MNLIVQHTDLCFNEFMPTTSNYNAATGEPELNIRIKIPRGQSMLESEVCLIDELNEARNQATGWLLSRFDADGGPIEFGGQKWTSKGKVAKEYQTPYACQP